MAVTRDELLKYLGKHALKRREFKKISDDTALFSSGIIDSFAMVDLLSWLEKKTGGRFAPDDLHLDNLDSIERILRFAESQTR